MKLPEWIADLVTARQTGLAIHYPLIWSLVIGLEARRIFEFGTGPSSAVLLDALECVDGWMHHNSGGARVDDILLSVSTDNAICTKPGCGGTPEMHGRWHHLIAHSEALPPDEVEMLSVHAPFDFVLHDGSHAADVVASDLRFIAPHVRQYGMIAIHDTHHSYVGAQMREGVREGLHEVAHSKVTLPYGYGLTLVRIEESNHPPRKITREKIGSPHHTEPFPQVELYET